VLIFILMQFY